MFKSLSVTTQGAVLEIVLDRPKANAIDNATSRELGESFIQFRDDPELRVAILTAAGDRFFSAGWDLKAAAAGDASPDDDYGRGGFAGLTELFDLNKPVICAVNGIAAGGGFELALAADLIVAAKHAEFFLPEVNTGLIANAGGVIRLPRRLPRAIAMDMLVTGRRMTTGEAMQWGLINAVVPQRELLARARKFADDIVAAAPLSVAATKEIVRQTEGQTVEEAYSIMRSGKFPAYEKVLVSEDSLEGPRAFAENRAPIWKGR
ncbi:MAG: carnitinyl-CoA dehydratase [Gammaproteobacteria bacterium]|nr:carnitinyl-CoA dehydratase [Gammaproteobacteria bacterium]